MQQVFTHLLTNTPCSAAVAAHCLLRGWCSAKTCPQLWTSLLAGPPAARCSRLAARQPTDRRQHGGGITTSRRAEHSKPEGAQSTLAQCGSLFIKLKKGQQT
eukprot:365303-Chlamydomonas_euryale.AAC.47